jgi:hypothetical protein
MFYRFLKFWMLATPKGHSAVLLNRGLSLAMAWGEHLLAPIQQRLGREYPALSSAELDDVNAACQAAMKFGHAAAYALASEGHGHVDPQAFKARVKSRYPWVDSANIARLFTQSMYYAWKDGLA